MERQKHKPQPGELDALEGIWASVAQTTGHDRMVGRHINVVGQKNEGKIHIHIYFLKIRVTG